MAGLMQYYYFPTDFFYPKPHSITLSETLNNNNNSNQHQPPQQQNPPAFKGSTQESDCDDSDKQRMKNRYVAGRDLRMAAKAVKVPISLQLKNLKYKGCKSGSWGRVEKL